MLRSLADHSANGANVTGGVSSCISRPPFLHSISSDLLRLRGQTASHILLPQSYIQKTFCFPSRRTTRVPLARVWCASFSFFAEEVILIPGSFKYILCTRRDMAIVIRVIHDWLRSVLSHRQGR